MNQRRGVGSRLDRRSFLTAAFGTAVSIPVLAACSGGSGGALGGSGGSSGGEVNELIMPINKSPWLPAFRELAAQYSEESGVKITLREFPYEGLKTAMTNAIQADAHPFDVFLLDEPWTGQFYANDWVTPLSDIDSSYAWDPEIIDYDHLPRWEDAKGAGTADGKVMGLPVNGNVNVFVYRKDLYEELGLSVPKTFDEVVANAKKAQESGKAKYGYAVRAQATSTGQSITYDFMPLLYSYGGDWYEEDWTPAINNKGAVAAMEMFKELTSFGPPQPQTVGQAAVIAAMQSGQALQCHTVAAAAPQIEDPEKSNVAGKVGFAPMPAGSTGNSTPTSGVWSLTVPSGLDESRAKATYQFITWVMKKQSQLSFVEAGGIPTRTDTYDADSLPQEAKPYLKAISDGLPHVRRAVRFPFSADMLPHAEQKLSAIAAGDTPVKAGLDELADTLAEVARKAGYGK